jgi:A/G-specific adenine glycosylase
MRESARCSRRFSRFRASSQLPLYFVYVWNRMRKCYLPVMNGGERRSEADTDRSRIIRKRLLDAFDVESRDLPWRGERDPYRIWVSEVMLQQTRVETVVPYYRKWVERFPDLTSLAGAEEDEVLRLWQGLGYYSRARRLHGAAKMVREEWGESLPETAEELQTLPGVGEYTAGAVASIAFGEAVPAVDGNARRVLSRLFDLAAPGPAELRDLAAELVDPERPGAFNQALMELGSVVCTPRAPSCRRCPVADVCLALERGTVDHRPAPTRKKAVPEVEEAVVVAARVPGPELLVRKRPASGLLAGMWEFPGERVEEGEEAAAAVRRLVGGPGIGRGGDAGEAQPVPGSSFVSLPPVPHAFSHLKVLYRPFLLVVREGAGAPELKGGRWAGPAEMEFLPFPVAQRKIREAALDALERE